MLTIGIYVLIHFSINYVDDTYIFIYTNINKFFFILFLYLSLFESKILSNKRATKEGIPMFSLTQIKQHRKWRIVLCMTLLLIMTALIAGCGNDKYVDIVRNGSFYGYPNIKIGKAFDQFFEDSKWKSFTTDDDERVVEFTGKCLVLNQKAKVLIQFTINKDETFEVNYSSINDEPMADIIHSALIEKVMENYRKTK